MKSRRLVASTRSGSPAVVLVRRSDQGKVILKRDRKEHAAVRILENIASIVGIEPGRDDVAALDETDGGRRFASQGPGQDIVGPRAGCVHQNARLDLADRECFLITQGQFPDAVFPSPGEAAGPRRDHGAPLKGVHRV